MNRNTSQSNRGLFTALLVLVLYMVGITKMDAENISFADDNVKAVCVEHWDTDGDGELSYAEAAAVTDIGQVFAHNNSITSFDEFQFFTGVTTLGQYAFGWCSLESIVLPSSLTTLDRAFYACGHLVSIIIPQSVSTISNGAFSGCDELEQIIVDAGNLVYDSRGDCNAIIHTEDNVLIQGCKTTTIPNTVSAIVGGAFSLNDGLTTIAIPASVVSVSHDAFYACSSLETIVVDPNNPVYDSRDNCNAIIQSGTNKLVTGCNNTVIPNTVTSIGAYAFSYRSVGEDNSLVIPNSVTVLEARAFLGCRSMVSITLPHALVSIGESCFKDCWSLESITILVIEPPVAGQGAFGGVNKDLVLTVPCGATEAYQNAAEWSEFTNIQEDCENSFFIGVAINPFNGGVVTGAGVYPKNTICEVVATANAGYMFVNWTEGEEVVSTNTTYSFVVTSNRNLVANFTLLGNTPTGAINGLFSVNDTTAVYFSQGNLQYQASTNTWRFAENQWNYVGENNVNINATYEEWIDLFSWGTSGYDHGAVCYQPWVLESTGQYNHAAYGCNDCGLNDFNGQADWGYNPIMNGGNTEHMWHTLSRPEWQYLLNTRTTVSGARFAKANVNGVNGLVVLPDNWDPSLFVLNSTNNQTVGFDANSITEQEWMAVFEKNGAVFLPAAGEYHGSNGLLDVNSRGFYWTSSSHLPYLKHRVLFSNESIEHGSYYPHCRYSVRLVHSLADVISYSIEATPSLIEGGEVTGSGNYDQGVTCTLTATANEGYAFVNWTKNGVEVSTEPTYTFTVTESAEYVANFIETHPQPSPQEVVISLYPGWNWFSYLLTVEVPLDEALVNLTPSEGDVIKGMASNSTYDASSHSWQGSLNSFVPGAGYMYLNTSTEVKSFTYPAIRR